MPYLLNDLFDSAGFLIEVSSIPRSSNVICCRLNTFLPNEGIIQADSLFQSSIHIDKLLKASSMFFKLWPIIAFAIESDKLVTKNKMEHPFV